MITAEVSFEGDVMYIGGKMITFEQTVVGDRWEIEGLDEAFVTLEELVRHCSNNHVGFSNW